MALKSIEDTDLVDGSLIKHFCDTCNKNVVMKVWFAPQGMVGTCHVCKKRTILLKNENYEEPTRNIPKCPTCQSTNIKKITMTSKAVNTVMFGIYGSKRHKTFHCNNCGYEW